MQDQENQEMPNQAEGQDQQAPAQESVAAENPLEAQLSATEAKLADMHDAFMRAKADAENIRRRAQEDVSKAHKFAVESFAEALLPVRDSLEMALKVESGDVAALRRPPERRAPRQPASLHVPVLPVVRSALLKSANATPAPNLRPPQKSLADLTSR